MKNENGARRKACKCEIEVAARPEKENVKSFTSESVSDVVAVQVFVVEVVFWIFHVDAFATACWTDVRAMNLFFSR